MQFLRNLPIKRKLMLIIMGVSSSVLLLAGASFIAYEQAAARKWMAQDLAITAAMAGANSTAGLSFDEPDSVNQALQSLLEQPDIVQACVYDKTGRLFARYVRIGIRENAPPIGNAGHQFDRDRLRLYQPINLAGEQVGTIYLETDLKQLNDRFWHYLQIMALVLVSSAAVAFFLSASLQGLISRPLSDLAGIVTLVAMQKNYSVRATKTAADEMGRLIDGFNEMLAQIQERDANLERRVAERTLALAESEANYHSLVDQMPAGIYRKNKEGRYVYVNAWFCRFKGIKPEDYLGKTAAEVPPSLINSGVVPSDPDGLTRAAAEHHKLILQNGQPIEVEETYKMPDGRIVFLQVVKSPVFGPDGAVVGSQAMLLDITQRKQAQERIAREQARLQFIFDSVPVGISLARRTAEGQLAERIVNDAHLRICGLTREQNEDIAVYGRITHPEDRLQQRKLIDLVNTGKIDHYSMEKRYVRPDGKTVWVTLSFQRRRTADGSCEDLSTVADITEVKYAAAELTHERELLRALLEYSADSIFFKDRQSRYVKLSQSEIYHLYQIARSRYTATDSAPLPPHLSSLEQFQGYVPGKTDSDIYGPERGRDFENQEAEIIRSGRPVVGKIEKITLLDGREIWLLATKMPWRDNRTGDIIGTFGTSSNITALKEAEAKVEQAQKQLLEASRRAGMAEVATSVLHNVGNVLNSINVSTTLALETIKKSRLNNLSRLGALIHGERDRLGTFFTADPRGRKLPDYLKSLAAHLESEQAALHQEIELTRKNVEHIKDIVSMQQTYAKVSGVVEKVTVTELVEDALRMNTGALTRHHVQITRDYPAEAVQVYVERQKVLQILVNLIRNAKYACDESGRSDKQIILRVHCRQDRIRIIAEDNGVGILAENLTRIFSHGFTTRETGHGFGLHSGALAAREMGGSLTVHSDGPGCGAVFTLELPLVSPANPGNQPSTSTP